MLPAHLSPSRANDFLQCPQLFKFRVIDKLPEPASEPMARGTLVHWVLEHLFEQPAQQRTLKGAIELVEPGWEAVSATDKGIRALLEAGETSPEQMCADAKALLATYFTLEDPSRLEPQARELRMKIQPPDAPLLRGVVDRVDVSPDGLVRVVDYKTGKAPKPTYENKALFQMQFYALMWWLDTGTVPARLTLHYLGDGTTLSYDPTQRDIDNTLRKVRAIWADIEHAYQADHWRPNPSALCSWCYHYSRCPAQLGKEPDDTAASVDPRAT